MHHDAGPYFQRPRTAFGKCPASALLKMKARIGMGVALALTMAFGCSRPEKAAEPGVGVLNMGTNALVATVPPGTLQDEVKSRAVALNPGMSL